MTRREKEQSLVTDREILMRYRQGSSIKHLTQWVSFTQGVGATKAREMVEQAIYSSLPKAGETRA